MATISNYCQYQYHQYHLKFELNHSSFCIAMANETEKNEKVDSREDPVVHPIRGLL